MHPGLGGSKTLQLDAGMEKCRTYMEAFANTCGSCRPCAGRGGGGTWRWRRPRPAGARPRAPAGLAPPAPEVGLPVRSSSVLYSIQTMCRAPQMRESHPLAYLLVGPLEPHHHKLGTAQHWSPLCVVSLLCGPLITLCSLYIYVFSYVYDRLTTGRTCASR